jgi:hypothetical protein
MATFNPQTWQQMNILLKNQMLDFMKQLANWASWIQSASGLSSILNGSAALASSSLKYVTQNFGTITANQTLNVSGAASVVAVIQVATAFAPTLTLTGLSAGALVVVRFINSSAGAVIFKLAATSPTYVCVAHLAPATTTNLTSTGISIPAGGTVLLVGAGDASLGLYLSQT